MERYLAEVHADELTIATSDEVARILEDVFAADRGAVAAVVQRAVPEASVADLRRVSPGIWPPLAADKRFPATFANVSAYATEFGIDESLAVVLGPGSIDTPSDVDDETKRPLLERLLASTPVLPSADVRARLIRDLDFNDWLDPAIVPVERGEWIGRLIEHQVLPDHSTSFARIASDDWPGREFAISVSSKFESFLSPAVLPATSIAFFFASDRTADDLKDAVVERFDEFAPGTGRAGLVAMATHANRRGLSLTLQNVAQIAGGGGAAALVLATLQPLLGSATLPALEPILTALGDDYELLAAPSAKQPKLPATPENRALLARLYELERVSSFPEKHGFFRVFLRHQ